MSTSLSSIVAIVDGYKGQPGGQADRVAQSLRGMENSPQEMGLRSKLKRFWKRTRIPSVVKKIVAGSVLLLNRLAPRFAPDDTSSETVHMEETIIEPRVERVKFPDDMIPSPTSSPNAASPYSSADAPILNIHRNASVQTPTSSPTQTLHHTEFNDRSVDEQPTPSENAVQNSFSERYKEKLEKHKSFPEIDSGVVGSRVKWLEPVLPGKKAGEENYNQAERGILPCVPASAAERASQALEIHGSSGLAPKTGTENAEEVPRVSESDDKFAFDDPPRLFKHRLPKEEPKPWVEPGTVARGAVWLQPVMSRQKRGSNGDSDPGNVISPTRVVHGAFR